MPDPTPHKPTDKTRAEVAALASYGIPQREISKYIGIDGKTLGKYYREEIDKAAMRANAAVARVLFEKATQDRDSASVFFWLKTRAGWREVNRTEITGAEGAPLKTESRIGKLELFMEQKFKEIFEQSKDLIEAKDK